MEELNHRDEVEREIIALLILRKDSFNLIQVKSKFFGNKDLGRLFSYCMESYSENKTICPSTIAEKHKDFNVDLFTEIVNNTFCGETSWRSQLDYCQEEILKYYKKDYIKELNDKLESKEMTYELFMEGVKSTEKINITDINTNRMKTINEINMDYVEQTFIKTNCNVLDKKTNGFALGELTIWSGSNGSAKSTFLGQMAIETINQGLNVAMFSGELTDKRLLNWLTLQSAGKSNITRNDEKNYYFVNSYAKEKILKWLDNKLYVYDNTFGNKANEILESVRTCIDNHNIKVVILDNLMSMNLASYGDQKYDVQTKLVTELSALAKEKQVHIHFVCHPRKSLSFLRKNDISGTADLTNIADNVIIMHRVNVDFKTKTKEMFGWNEGHEIYQYTNVLEVCKNREYGVEDEFIGMYFEIESKRLLNYKDEQKCYGWIK